MFFTIEPMVNLGRPETKVLDDDWTAVTKDRSLSAQFEHSVGVTETGCEIFTLSPAGRFHPTWERASDRSAGGRSPPPAALAASRSLRPSRIGRPAAATSSTMPSRPPFASITGSHVAAGCPSARARHVRHLHPIEGMNAAMPAERVMRDAVAAAEVRQTRPRRRAGGTPAPRLAPTRAASWCRSSSCTCRCRRRCRGPPRTGPRRSDSRRGRSSTSPQAPNGRLRSRCRRRCATPPLPEG